MLKERVHSVSDDDVDRETIVSVLRRHAQFQPHQIAYRFLADDNNEESSLTFSQLDRSAQHIAKRLLSHVVAGDRALLLFRPGLDYIVAFLGCMYAGIVPVPLNLPTHERHLGRPLAVLEDVQANLALTSGSDIAKMQQLFTATNSKRARSLRWIATDISDSMIDTYDFEPAINPDALAFLQYTSGSTGSPKGVMLTHKNLLHNQRTIEKSFEHSQKTVFAGWLPLFHDMGLIGNVLQPLYLGVPCILISPIAFLQKPFRWLQMISRYRATTSGGPNFAYDLCVRRITEEQRSTLDLSSWEVAFCGAEPVRAETLDRFSQAFKCSGFRREALYPCYGMAEATLLIAGGFKNKSPVYAHADKAELEKGRAVTMPDKSIESRTLVGCGRPYLGQKILIVDPETLTACPSDRVGEIWVSGESVAKGYWQRPDQTKATFDAYLADTKAGPFLRTGDLGFIDDVELFITGRLKDLLIFRGKNHAPEDIELTISQVHPALRLGAGAAFSVEVMSEEKLVVAQEVEREYLRTLDLDSVVDDIREAIAAEHGLQLHAVVLLKVGSIPRTSSGKVQRHQCRQRYLDGSLDQLKHSEAPQASPKRLHNMQESVQEDAVFR